MPGLPVYEEWRIRQGDEGAARCIQAALGVSPITARVLAARGASTPAAARLMCELPETPAYSAWLLPDSKPAVQRLAQAVRHQERTVIYGDFDADGQTATALMILALRRFGLAASYYVPRRLEEGYGLNASAVTDLAAAGYSLLVTVDCGTSAAAEVALAAELGVDCIVTDHHEPGASLAQPLALVNPKCGGSYPWPHLAGVGVAYRLMEALAEELGAPVDLSDLLDLVAVGTIADVVPLQDENRLLAGWGLRRLNTDPRPGLAALIQVAGGSLGRIDAYNVAFQLAPRLNAAGRVADAAIGVDLLLAEEEAAATAPAAQLDHENRQRQAVEEQVLAEARTVAADYADAPVIVVEGDDWHPGVVGIVAARLVEAFGRPALVLARAGESAVGSGRSVAGFHLAEALQACQDILIRYGGHAMAAGLTVATANIDCLRARLAALYLAQMGAEPAPRSLEIDCLIEEPNQLQIDVLDELNRLGPFGFGNPQPVLAWLDGAPREVRYVGKEKNHVRMVFPVGRSQLCAIGFRLGEQSRAAGAGDLTALSRFDLAFTLQVNEWNGRRELELRLKDLRPASVAQAEVAAVAEETGSICVEARAYRTSCAGYLASLLQRGLTPVVWLADSAEAEQVQRQLQNAGASGPCFLVWPGSALPPHPGWAESRCALVLRTPPVGAAWRKLASVIGAPAEVHLAYTDADVGSARRLVAGDWPDRDGLARVYRYMEQCAAGVTVAQLAAACRLSPAGAEQALNILAELQLAAPQDERWHLLPKPGRKLDLAIALGYNDCIAQRQQAEAILAPGLSCAAIWRLALPPDLAG